MFGSTRRSEQLWRCGVQNSVDSGDQSDRYCKMTRKSSENIHTGNWAPRRPEGVIEQGARRSVRTAHAKMISRCWGGCRHSQRTLRRPYWIAEFPATIGPTLNDSHSPSRTKTSPSKIILSLPPRDIFLASFHAAFTARRVGQAVLGVSIGTWHEMHQVSFWCQLLQCDISDPSRE
jgi:hypothetical protein